MVQEAFKTALSSMLDSWKKHVVAAAGSEAQNPEEKAAVESAVNNTLGEVFNGVKGWIDSRPDQAYEWACNAVVEFDEAAKKYEAERDAPPTTETPPV